ncbi:MAG: NAD-dependent epimerase/dehydratase family protein [Alphaproteobacteria bacterium]
MIEATRLRGGVRYITVGSVMERTDPLARANRYIASKIALAQALLELASQDPGVSALHLRLHTLYGSRHPHPHMFIGQIAQCLLSDTPFAMSTGLQYRQYHHVDDIAQAIGTGDAGLRLSTRRWSQDANWARRRATAKRPLARRRTGVHRSGTAVRLVAAWALVWAGSTVLEILGA